MYQPRSLLVTGAAGFIGSHFVDWCLKQKGVERVISYDALTYAGNQENLAQAMQDPRHEFVHADINDQDRLRDIVQKNKIDTIVHFAAESHVDRSISGPQAFVMTNMVGTFALLDVARTQWPDLFDDPSKQCRFHHISTDEVYGTLSMEDPAFSETTPYSPNSPYSASKAGSDHLVNAYFHTYGLPTVTTNCSNNYGPRQAGEKLIPTIINAAMSGKPIPIYGDGSNIRDWLYVEDHCSGIWDALTQGELGHCYNIGGDSELCNLDLAKLICTQLDAAVPRENGSSYQELIHFVTDRPGHDWRYAINHDKLTALSDWSPAATLNEGLNKTIAFYIKDAV